MGTAADDRGGRARRADRRGGGRAKPVGQCSCSRRTGSLGGRARDRGRAVPGELGAPRPVLGRAALALAGRAGHDRRRAPRAPRLPRIVFRGRRAEPAASTARSLLRRCVTLRRRDAARRPDLPGVGGRHRRRRRARNRVAALHGRRDVRSRSRPALGRVRPRTAPSRHRASRRRCGTSPAGGRRSSTRLADRARALGVRIETNAPVDALPDGPVILAVPMRAATRLLGCGARSARWR